MTRKKKFFAAISLIDKEEREAISYAFHESCEISGGYVMSVHNPVMAFIMDKVKPDEELDLYLILCRGDCANGALSGSAARNADNKISTAVAKRLQEILGAGNGLTVDSPVVFDGASQASGDCDLNTVREMFRKKNGADADFRCTVHLVDDSDSEGNTLGNSSKAYIQLLRKLIKLIEDHDIIYVDTTYGFKPLSEVWRNLCIYAVRAKTGAEVGAFSYGSLYGVTNENPTIFNNRAFLVMGDIMSNAYDNKTTDTIINDLLEDLQNDNWDEDDLEDEEV
ncbi:MAG: hypothetical protein LBN99_04655 [Oscillospiraceae bacterium]|jgi:hypothetical protein|nr:hypothetical protein [Oscillospiraceae bacterium]